MAGKDLTHYFQRRNDKQGLPSSVSQTCIDSVNKELSSIKQSVGPNSRGEYIKITAKDRAVIGEYAAKNGIAAAIRHFKRNGQFPSLKETSVRGWKNAYCKELLSQSSRKRGPVEIVELPQKRRGRPLLLGDELEQEVKIFIKAARERGTVVNTETVMGTARGVVISHDANLLLENGGYINITKDWAQRLLQRMNLVKRKGTTKIKVLPSDFEKLKKQFLSDIRSIVAMEDIPKELIINWDQTGMKYVPVSNWTFEEKGTKRIEIAGLDDKRQITVLLSCTMDGNLLPTQVIYAGKTPACLPKDGIPTDWYLTYSENHWANEHTMMGYLHNILLPYVNTTRVDLKLDKTHPAVVIFDTFRGQTTQAFLDTLEENNILVVEIPPNCTDRLQPLDLAVNKPVKDQMKRQFHHWYAEEVQKKIKDSASDNKIVDLKLSRLKPLGLQWLVNACSYVQRNDFIQNGFSEAGITSALTSYI